MLKVTSLLSCLLLIYSSLFLTAFAKTYKCTDDNGAVTYSQTACKKNQKTGRVMSSSKQIEGMEDCKYAGLFAKLVVGQMRSDASAKQVFDRYGGKNSISKSTRGVINYVYSFKYARDTPTNRITALTISRCNAKAFGNVKCEDFPADFQDRIYSCDEEKRKEAYKLQKLLGQGVNNQSPLNDLTGTYGNPEDQAAKSQKRINGKQKLEREYEKQRVLDCKQFYDSKIDKIDKRMKSKYSPSFGESLRDRRRKLVKERKTECR